jgi:hypothetical protein
MRAIRLSSSFSYSASKFHCFSFENTVYSFIIAPHGTGRPSAFFYLK